MTRAVADRFSPATARWFTDAFAAPTEVQSRGWDVIASEQHALLVAPTGSGKTLAAFLWCIDCLVAERAGRGDVSVLYISPLKALVYDVERNLRTPLAGIARAADDLATKIVLPRVGIRTGDTSAKDRRRMIKEPPDILVTTPESLYLLLGSQAREALRNVDTVIVDEVHALAPTKRGAHLALSLERLEAFCDTPPQRIGLSATARPLDTVAKYLGGTHPVNIVDTSQPPRIDLEVIVPVADMTRPEPHDSPAPSKTAAGSSGSDSAQRQDAHGSGADTPGEKGLWPTIYPRLVALIRDHQTTIIFVNSRGLCERLTQRLNELAGEQLCRSHHGSVSHDERRGIEEQLKAGHLRAIVATSSLELGIDMGAVDLVVLISSPGAVARGLQRIGRAGHSVGEASVGRIFPKHRGDLLEVAVVSERMQAGHIEAIDMPENPLDILAQQIVAAVATDDWSVGDLRACFQRAANFRALPDSAFEAVLDMLSGRYPSHSFADLSPRLVWDRQDDRLSARRGAKMLSLVSGGTIPDRGTYGVYLVDGGSRVGELDEEMVHETVAGDVFTLGASSWRVEQITRDRVLVTPAPGQIGKLPFWRGDGPGRSLELGRAIGAFVRELTALPRQQALERLRTRNGLDDFASANLLAYLDEQREATKTAPTDKTLVVERFRDELGDWRVCILSPFGARVHGPWALAIETKLSALSGFEVQTMWTDDGIALRLVGVDELPVLESLFPDPDDVEELIVDRLGGSALFAGQFRENAARSLLLPRQRPGKRMPLWVQRLKSQELLAVAKQFPSFPVIIETYRSCLQDIFDVPALVDVLRGVRARSLEVVEAVTTSPSPFARSLAFAYVATYLYEGDAPLAERRAQALALDRKLLGELLGHDELRELLDSDVIAQLARELQYLDDDRQISHADGLHRMLRRLGDLTEAEIAARCDHRADEWLAALARQQRVIRVEVAGESRVIAIEDAGLYRDALECRLPSTVPQVFLEPVDDALAILFLRFAKTHVPFTVGELAGRFGVTTAVAEVGLKQLQSQGKVESGAFRPDGSDAEWCGVEILRRIKRRTLAVLRNEVAPVEPAQLARFLGHWHGITSDSGKAGHGLVRLREAIVQLEGLPVSFSELERKLLPDRVADFTPAMLDELSSVGWLTWIGHGALGSRDGKVALYRREKVPYLYRATEVSAKLSPLAERVRERLDERGALFFAVLRDIFPEADLPELVAAVRELMWNGLVSNDTFAPLRSSGVVGGRGRVRALLQSVGGRWSSIRELVFKQPNPTEMAHARANKLLERHGIVSREVSSLEPSDGGFSAVYAVLKEMEDIGKVRRGYFIEGVGGAQFALPGVVDRLRAAHERAGTSVVLAATDPANPYGWLLPWPTRQPSDGQAKQPRRVAGAYVVLAGGIPVVYLGPGGKQLLTFPSADDSEVFVDAVGALAGILQHSRKRFLRIEKIDGERAGSTGFVDGLMRAGYRRMPNGFERER